MERGAALRNMNTGVVIVMEETYDQSRRKIVVPIWEKSNLTLEEAAAYSGIGIHRVKLLFLYKTIGKEMKKRWTWKHKD